MARLHKAAFSNQRPWSAHEFIDLIADPAVTLVANRNGFGLIRTIPPEAELLTLVVAPHAQRNGLGSQLLEALVAAAQAAGAPEMFLEVAASNSGARALYSRAGFEATGKRANYYRHADGRAEDAILMRRKAA